MSPAAVATDDVLTFFAMVDVLLGEPGWAPTKTAAGQACSGSASLGDAAHICRTITLRC